MPFAAHHRLYACFFLFASITGAMFSRMPDIQQALSVNEAQLGLTLIGGAIGSLISLTFSAPLIEKAGARLTCLVTLIGSTLFYSSVPFIHSAPVAFGALFLAGLLSGAMEINLNVELGRLEAYYKRSIMSRAHGFWSLGFFVTSLIATGVRQAAIPATWHLGVAFVIAAIAALVFIWGMTNAPRSAAMDAEKAPLVAFPNAALVPLCLIGIAAFLVEGAGVDWSAIYMRDTFAAEPFIGGLGLTAFTFVMAIMRIYIGPFVDRFGPRRVSAVLLGLCIVGLIAVWLAPNTAVAIVGFALMGGGCSAVYPLAVSAAAQRTDRPSSVNVAAIGQITFVIFFLAPPLLGFVAHSVGIRWSYVVCLPLVILAILMVRALPARVTPSQPGQIVPEPLSPNG